MVLKTVAQIRTDFPAKFGLPRQSGLVEELCGKIVFEPLYRNPEALRGLEGYSHLWLLWGFSERFVSGKMIPEQMTGHRLYVRRASEETNGLAYLQHDRQTVRIKSDCPV